MIRVCRVLPFSLAAALGPTSASPPDRGGLSGQEVNSVAVEDRRAPAAAAAHSGLLRFVCRADTGCVCTGIFCRPARTGERRAN
jgi:hypothetical protein